jgi:hypothetical protein
MKRTFNAVIKQDDGWWIGWVEEIPGVNSLQGKTRWELGEESPFRFERSLGLIGRMK